jgi:hypothetical protein
MRNVKNANFWQQDHKIKNISEVPGNIILSSPQAWEKYSWAKKYFSGKPKEGYFIWIREQTNFPLFSCISISNKGIRQNLQNLLIVEKKIKVQLKGVCNSLKKDLNCSHKAKGKIILKEDSFLEYEHIHSWGQKDIVEPDYEFFLEKNSKLSYKYKNLFPPEKLKIKTDFYLLEKAVVRAKTITDCSFTQTEIKDNLFLKGKESSGEVQLRIVGRENSKVYAQSQILAEVQSKGHLDCQGLLSEKNSVISLEPKLVCQNKDAELTHESSIGKISEEELNYLRQRGFSQKEAIDLIISGFLEK